jgi:S1-C subfamily serine protease
MRLTAPLAGLYRRGVPLGLLVALTLVSPAARPLAPHAVLVAGGGFHGAGIVWARGRVLTALHVVEEMPDVTVALGDRAPAAARVVDRDPALDLALLAVEEDLGAAPAIGASEDLAPGSAVAFSGCPRRTCSDATAVLLEASRAFAGSRYLALAAHVRPGASGGPVLDGRGALIGIVDLAVGRDGEVALAVPVERAIARFPRNGASSR